MARLVVVLIWLVVISVCLAWSGLAVWLIWSARSACVSFVQSDPAVQEAIGRALIKAIGNNTANAGR